MDACEGVDDYLLDCEPGSSGSGVNRKTNAQRNRKLVNPGMYKVVRGDGLTKKEQMQIEASVFEDMQSNVFYSLKKQKRWESASSAENVLMTAVENRLANSVGVLEKRDDKSGDCHLFGRVEGGTDDIVMSGTKSGRATAIKNLEDSIDIKRGKDVRNKGAPEPELTIVIVQPDKEAGVKSVKGRNVRKSRQKYDYFEGFEGDVQGFENVDEDEAVDRIEENGDADKGQMLLSDFIVTASDMKEKRKKRESSQSGCVVGKYEDDVLPAVVEETARMNYHQELIRNSTFLETSIDLTRSIFRTSNFLTRLEQWVEKECRAKMYWIDEDRTKCLVDLSKMFDVHNMVAVIGFHVVCEPVEKRSIKMIINTTFPCSFDQQNVDECQEFVVEKPNNHVQLLMDQLVVYLTDGFSLSRVPKRPTELGRLMYKVSPDYPIVKTWNEYELMDKVAESVRLDGSNLTNEEDSDSNPSCCELCGGNFNSLVKLCCPHAFCEKCLKFVLTEQVLSDSTQLTCPICSRPQNVRNFLMTLPVNMVKAVLKNSLRDDTCAGTERCPKCENVIKTIVGESNYKCSTCQTAFCQNCKLAPHFPLSCAQMKQFHDSDVSFRYVPDEHTGCNRQFECPCGFITHSDHLLFECSNCMLFFRMHDYWTTWDSRNNCYATLKDYDKNTKYDDVIIRQYGCKFNDARNELFYGNHLELLQTTIKPFLTWKEIQTVMGIRYKALRLLFFGHLWLHFERKTENKSHWKKVNTALNQLRLELDRYISSFSPKNKQSFETNNDKLIKVVEATSNLFCKPVSSEGG